MAAGPTPFPHPSKDAAPSISRSGGRATPDSVGRILAGCLASGAVALAAMRGGELRISGAIAATLVGIAAFAAGWNWAILLLAYFALNTLVTRALSHRAPEEAAGIISKRGARDHAQVLSNGLVFAIAATVHALNHNQDINPASTLLIGAGALAASTADTWATEIGMASGTAPRSVLTWKKVPTGISGGVTLAGTGGALLASLLIAGVGVVTGIPSQLWPAVAGAGITGALVDTLLGATVQEKRLCVNCQRITERKVHSCGANTQWLSGAGWINNDAVNFLCTAAGGVTALLITLALLRI